ncbi:extracellular solute-binding protein [Plantactinospora soyae]|uniref:Multiple sugar transport system substrate-binding protein n=1 Tax=Plantactinospora soyae TaxID=1544732 RepID=A0A927MB98_9ACTN|nr:extracellular solute-binding protein [Plantactinospora soyae]MBE1491583.1 multiple sugar transport system substrate-binding protein [Plantactinospora soyae]
MPTTGSPTPTGPPTSPGGDPEQPRRNTGRRRWWRAFALGNLSGLLVAALVVTPILLLRGPEELEPGELVILSGGDDGVGGQRNALIELWNASHPRNPARIIELPEASDGQHAQMVNWAQTNPEIDVFNLDVTWTAEFASTDRLRPIVESRLLDKPDEVFLKNPLSTCRYDGKLWAMPFNTDAGLLFYRREPGLRPPFDWSAITSASGRALAARPPGSPLEAGYTSQLDSYEGLTVNALEALWAAGGELHVDRDGQVSVDRDRWTGALRPLTPGAASSVVLPDALNQDENRSREAFRAGKVMFMRNWPVAYRSLSGTDATPAPAGAPPPPASFQFDVTALPGPSVLGGQNLAIAKQTGQPRAAQALIAFLTGEQSQRILFQRGGFAATRTVVYADEAINQQYPYVKLLLDAVNGARLRPVSPYYVNFSLVLRGHVRAVLDGGDLPADLDERLTQALRGLTPPPPPDD